MVIAVFDVRMSIDKAFTAAQIEGIKLAAPMLEVMNVWPNPLDDASAYDTEVDGVGFIHGLVGATSAGSAVSLVGNLMRTAVGSGHADHLHCRRVSVPPWTIDLFVCPRCEASSPQVQDIEQGYCGRCHDWTGTQAVTEL